MQEREPQRRLHRCGPKVTFNAGQDRREPHQLAIRVQAQDCVDQVIAAVGNREALPKPSSNVIGADIARGPLAIRGTRLGDLVVGPLLLVAAHRTPVTMRSGSQ